MTLWFVPVWLIFVSALTVVLIGVLIMTLHEHHGLRRKVGTLTPYSEQHASNLQRRVERIVTVSAAQRETLRDRLTQSDELSAETRAMRAALDAEREGEKNEPSTRH